MTGSGQREDKNDSRVSESLSSTSALTTPLVMDPADLLQDGLKIQKMVQVLPSEVKKCATMGKCRVCSVNKR
jgi:hypothetical protein